MNNDPITNEEIDALLDVPRHRHLAIVGTPPPVSRRHPSMGRPELFDWDDPDLAAADRCVILTEVEAKAIAGLLRSARTHLPSVIACDQAIELLTGKRP